ncbi:alpha/beta fold hydrolase [Streptomyces sp. NPDC054840]
MRRENELLARLLVPLALGETALESLTPEQVEAVVRDTAASGPPGSGDQVGPLEGADLRAELARIDAVPALVAVTTGDRLVPPALQREPADALPGASVAELPSGQLPFAERLAERAAPVTEFHARPVLR